jgi:glutamine synthetase
MERRAKTARRGRRTARRGGGLRFVRLAWGDTHGYSRAKTLTVPAFLAALTNGYNIGVATTTLDSAGARVFASFTRGGGMGLDEMTGSPNLTIVCDPATFRILPWAPGVGWILGDEYFNDGRPFHFSPRQLLRKTLQTLGERGCAAVIGPEIEWYLLRVADDHLSEDNIGAPGKRGRPIGPAGRARLSLSFRVQHGPDAARVRRARRRLRNAGARTTLD